jgi:hypothetical protein
MKIVEKRLVEIMVRIIMEEIIIVTRKIYANFVKHKTLTTLRSVGNPRIKIGMSMFLENNLFIGGALDT